MDTAPTPKHRAHKHHATTPRTLANRGLLILSVATVLTLSACSIPGLPGPTGAPSVEQAAALTPAPQPETNPPAEPEAPTIPTITGELIKGAVSHKLGAAGNQLIIDYWTDQNPATWTADTSPIIRLSASVAGATEKNAIKITRFNARIDATDTTLANDTGDFAVDAPHSYSSSIVVPGNPTAPSTRIIFTFDLLTETAPGSGIFTRQTVMDTLTLHYAVQSLPAPVSAAAPNKAATS
ncbi:hypothetical protein V3C41_01630 [Paenarthrobacter nicotinovorans]|uniref:Lipoprotein LpqN n=1 Tax=Paenarthrobacter nicotinovorans TaxID=29320 RepID=A0ABV0GMP5_PAENI